jgi:glutathione S-transferase
MLELDDGTCIGEAMAICRYFEELHPDPPLMGTDPSDKAIVAMWQSRAELEGLHAVAEVFRNSHPLFAGRALPGFAQRIEQIPALVERGKVRVAGFFEKFDNQLSENEFVAGSRFTVADITALCATDFGRKVCKLDIPEGCANFRRWHREVSVRSSAAT